MSGTRGWLSRLLGAALVAGSIGVPLPLPAHAAVRSATTTTTTLTSSQSPSGYGETLLLNAFVIPASGSVVPDGTVTFLDGAVSLGIVSLDSSGQSALAEQSLTAGTHSIVAAYSGSATFSPSNSDPLVQVITPQGSTTSVFAFPDPAMFGQTVAFVVTVFAAAGTATPTGNVTVLDGATPLATTSLDSNGIGFVTTSTLGVGVHAITADYLGDGNFTASSAGLDPPQVITQATTSLAVVSSANPATAGLPVTFTATVTPTSATGSVSFADGAVPLGSATVDGNGNAVITTSGLALGAHVITATYSGDTNFTASTSPPLTQVVDRALTITTLASTANPAELGTPVTLTALVTVPTGTATGTVTFTDGGAPLGAAILDGTGHATLTLTGLEVGVHSLVAAYGGDSTSGPSSSPPLLETITPASSQTTLTSPANPATFGDPLSLTAVVATSHTGPSGTVTFNDGATILGTATLDGTGRAHLTVTGLSVGSHTLSAAYSGDARTAASTSAPLVETVVSAPSATSVTTSGSPALVGQPVIFIATVTAGATTPTGSISFSDGASPMGTVMLDPNGQASLTTSALAPGTHTITTVYSGDANLGGSAAFLTQVVDLDPTTTSVTSSSNPATATTPVTLTATVTSVGGTPGGAVTFLDGGVSLGVVGLDPAGQATWTTSALSIGVHSLTVSYAGDGQHYAPSLSPAMEEEITAVGTQVALTASPNPGTVDQVVTLTATATSVTGATPVGSITFTDGGGALGTVAVGSDGVATLSTSKLGPGAHALKATFHAAAPFGGSTSAVFTETVRQAGVRVVLRSSENPSTYGRPVTLTATVRAAGSDAPTGWVTFFDGTTPLGRVRLDDGRASLTIRHLDGGGHALTALYGGDDRHVRTESNLVAQSVSRALTATVLSVTPNPARVDRPVRLSAGVSSEAGDPIGWVRFYAGERLLGRAPVRDGHADLIVSGLAGGEHRMTAVFGGSDDLRWSWAEAVILRVHPGEDCLGLAGAAAWDVEPDCGLKAA